MTPEQAASEFLDYLDEGLSLLGRITPRSEFDEIIRRRFIEIIHAQRESAVAEAMQWRPIATAPKDGTEILLNSAENAYYDGGVAICGYYDGPVIAKYTGRGCTGWVTQDKLDLAFESTTHWMPLPPAPPAQEGEG